MKNQSLKVILALAMSALYWPAMGEIVVVVNPKNPVTALSAEQVSQFYLGISNSFTPFDQSDSSPMRAQFYKKVTQKEPGQVRAIWAKLVFTGKGRPPKEFASNEEVKKAVAADPNGIGYIDKAALDASVKSVLSLP
jgi:ABC-type phosphate transport system substrate-binding protein